MGGGVKTVSPPPHLMVGEEIVGKTGGGANGGEGEGETAAVSGGGGGRISSILPR